MRGAIAAGAAFLLLIVAWAIFRSDAPAPSATAETRPRDAAAEPPAAPTAAPTSKIRVAEPPTDLEALGATSPFTIGGYVVRGTVTGPDGAPVARATVRVGWREDGAWPPVEGTLTATSDAAGGFEIEADGLLAGRPVATRLAFVFSGSARAPGYRTPPPRRERLRSPLATVVELDLALEVESGVTGRVVDAIGHAVPGAEVHFRDVEDGPEVSIGHTDEEGLFRADVPRPASWRVSAHAPGVGVAVAGPFDLDPHVPHRLPDLVCDAPGTLEGMAILPDGAAASGLEVLAFPASEIRRPASHLLSTRSHVGPEAFESLPGAWPAIATADADGRFRIAGLGPGTHFLLVRATDPAPDGRMLHPAGATGLLLRVARHRVIADVRAPNGEPAKARVGFVRGSTGLPPTGHDPKGRPCHDRFESGDVVTVEALAPGVGEARRTVELAPGVHETVVRVDLDPVARGAGRLVVTATGEDGTPPAVDRVRLRLFGHGEGTMLAVAHADLEVDAVLGEPIPLDAGTWTGRLVDAGEPWAFGPYRGSWFLPAGFSVTIEPGATATAELRLVAGGRIGLLLRRSEPTGEPERVRAEALVRAGSVHAVHFVREERILGDPWRPFDHRVLPFDVPLVATTLLPAGDATLTLHGPDIDRIVRTVEIEPRKTTAIELTLPR